MYRDATIAVVVPAYNEAGFVGDVIDEIPSFVDRAYVIDDGSTDDTWSEIQQHARRRNDGHEGVFEELIVPIRHETNRGVGGAIKTGYLRARAEEIDVTGVLGGDDQMNPDVLTRYIDPIVEGRADYTKGNRFARASHWDAMPRFRFLGNVILSYLTKIASGYWDVMDSQNGYTAISLDALEATDIEGMYEYYGYCNDLLVRLNVANVRVADVPRSAEYAYTDGWKSHINYQEYIPRVSLMLARSFAWRLRRKYLLQNYHPTVALYAVGTTALSAGIVGLVRSLLGKSDTDTGTWLLLTTLGSLTILGATESDRQENSHLAIDVTPDDEATRATELGPESASGTRAPEETETVPRSAPDDVNALQSDGHRPKEQANGNNEQEQANGDSEQEPHDESMVVDNQ